MNDRAKAKVTADFEENIMQYEYWLCSFQMSDIFGKRLYEAHESLTSDGGKERYKYKYAILRAGLMEYSVETSSTSWKNADSQPAVPAI